MTAVRSSHRGAPCLVTSRRALSALGLAAALATASLAQAQGSSPRGPRNADWIAAVVNQESVTAGEVERRIQRARAEAQRTGQPLPPDDQLRQLALDGLIDERAMITSARENGMRVDDSEVDRAVQNIALQNQLTPEVLRQRLAAEGIDFARFRANLRDQIMIERLREREVYQRIRVSDEEVERYLEAERQRINADAETNLAQILVTVPEGASPAVLAERQARAEAALARVRGGADFATVAREHHGWVEEMFAGIGADDRDQLYRLLAVLRGSLDQSEER